MTVQVTLPKDVEQRLLAEVTAGRHASLEEAIIEKLGRADEFDLKRATGLSADAIRADLNDAWDRREGAVNGEAFFVRLAEKSAALKARGK